MCDGPRRVLGLAIISSMGVPKEIVLDALEDCVGDSDIGACRQIQVDRV